MKCYNGRNIYTGKKFRRKGLNYLIFINKSEKEIIVKRFPNITIVRTMKQKSKRHHYYCEETKKVVDLLNAIRSGEFVSKEGLDYTAK